MFAIRRIFCPQIYQGRHKRKHFFEGWYFKQVSKDHKNIIAFIPGVSLEKTVSHAFVQVILTHMEGNEQVVRTAYLRFPFSDFGYSDDPFQIRIGKNIFSKDHVSVDLSQEHLNIKGSLKFGDTTAIKRSITAPNIMGYFGYLFFMECYHSVISMGHSLTGDIVIDDAVISFDNGRGYIEKDWGRSFPKDYIWIQCNHFKDKNVMFMLSLAHIPFSGSSFTGLICILILNGKEYRFATYNGSKIIKVDSNDKSASIKLKRKNMIIEIEAVTDTKGELVAPVNGHMDKIMKEGLTGRVLLKLTDDTGKIFYEDKGICAGVEIVRSDDCSF